MRGPLFVDVRRQCSTGRIQRSLQHPVRRTVPDDLPLDQLKLPPHSLEAEQSVLGGLMLDNDAADKIGDVLGADDFYSDGASHHLSPRHAAHRRRQAGRRRHACPRRWRRRRSSTTSAASRISARSRRTCRLPPTSVTTRTSCASARSCASSPPPRPRSPSRRSIRWDASAKMVLDEAEAKVLHIAEQGSRGRADFQEIGKLLATVVERIETLYNRDDPSDVTGVADGIRRSRPDDVGLAARRSHRRGGTTEHGQDGPGAQHRRERRARTPGCRSRCSRWRWARRSSPCG